MKLNQWNAPDSPHCGISPVHVSLTHFLWRPPPLFIKRSPSHWYATRCSSSSFQLVSLIAQDDECGEGWCHFNLPIPCLWIKNSSLKSSNRCHRRFHLTLSSLSCVQVALRSQESASLERVQTASGADADQSSRPGEWIAYSLGDAAVNKINLHVICLLTPGCLRLSIRSAWGFAICSWA